MIILTRKPREQITVITDRGERVTITVTSLTPGRCRLGIDCDRGWKVLRSELLKGGKDETANGAN